MPAPPYVPFPTVNPSGDVSGPGGPENFRPMNPDPFGGRMASTLEQGGQNLEQAGQNLGKIVLAKQELTNELTAQDAATDYMKKATALYGQFSQKQGKDALAALPEFQTQLESLWKQSVSSLPNAQAQRMLGEKGRWYLDRYLGYSQNYADEQQHKWADESSASAIDTYGSQAVLSVNNPEQMDSMLGLGAKEVEKRGELFGWSEDKVKQEQSKFIGHTLSLAVREQVDEGNLQAASGLLEHYRGAMDPQSILVATNALKPRLNEQRALDDRDRVIGLAPAATTAAGDNTDLPQRIMTAENRNHVIDAANPNSSAKGLGQFLDGTWLDMMRKYEPDITKGKTDAQVLAYRTDPKVGPALNAEMTARYAQENRAFLQSKGLPTDDGAVYMAHVAGPAGAAKALSADPSTPMTQVFSPAEAKANPQIAAMTVGQFHQWASGRVSPDNNQRMGVPDESVAMQRAQDQLGGDPDRLRRAQTQIRSWYSNWRAETAADRSEMLQAIPNRLAAVESGDAQPEDVDFPSFESMRAVGISAPQAQKWTEDFQIAQQIGPVSKAIRLDSPDEIRQVQEDLVAGKGAFAMLADPEHAKLKGVIAARLDAQINKRTADLKADPATWAATNDPTTQQAAQDIAGSSDPAAAFQKYATATLSIQSRVGVPTASQHVLPASKAQEISEKLQQPGTDVRQQLAQMHQTFGAAYPLVMRDISSLGKLPAAYMAVDTLDDPMAASQLSRGLQEGLTREEAAKRLGKDAIGGHTGIDFQITSSNEVNQWLNSLAASGASLPQVTQMQDAVKTLAYSKMILFGKSQGDAATEAVQAFTGKYEYMTGGARVPHEAYAATSINAGAALKAMIPAEIDIPEEYGKPGNPPPEGYIEGLRANPYWITHVEPNGSTSLWLLDQKLGIVRTRDGKPFSVPVTTTPAPGAAGAMQPPNRTRYQVPGG